MVKIFSKTWGELHASAFKIDGAFIIALDVTKYDGTSFQTECLIPVHDVTMLVPPPA